RMHVPRAVRESVRMTLAEAQRRRRPLGDRKQIAFAQLIAVAGEQRGRFVISGKERPIVERVIAAEVQEERHSVGLRGAWPGNASSRVSRPVGERVLVPQHPAGYPMPSQTSDDAER